MNKHIKVKSYTDQRYNKITIFRKKTTAQNLVMVKELWSAERQRSTQVSKMVRDHWKEWEQLTMLDKKVKSTGKHWV